VRIMNDLVSILVTVLLLLLLVWVILKVVGAM
jgi:hypothetical protein